MADAAQCTRCGREEATLHCPQCHDAPADVNTEFAPPIYCSAKCQRADYSRHLPICNQRRELRAFIRASNLLLRVYYIFLEAVYSTIIKGYTHKSGQPPQIIFTPDWDLMARRQDMTTRLPQALQNDDAIHHKKSILTFLRCTDSLTHMYKLAGWFLKGQATLTECSVRLRNTPLRILCIDDFLEVDNTTFKHALWKAELKNGLVYALDLSGAQYGWYLSYRRWDLWTAERCNLHLRTYAFGRGYGIVMETLRNLPEDPERWNTNQTHATFDFWMAERLADGLREFATNEELDPEQFLMTPEDVFAEIEEKLADEVHRIAQTFQVSEAES